MTKTNAKPSPAAHGLSAPYWEATRRGEILIQRCSNCHALRHYPKFVCSNCFSSEHDWVTASGRGKLHSWTITHHAFHPAFASELPYTLVTVDLEEGVRAMGRWVDGAQNKLAMGMTVQAHFEPRPDGFGELTFEAS